MKPDRAFIDLAFPHPVNGTFTPVKLHLEYPLAPNETEQDAWDAGKKTMEEWVNSRFYQPYNESKREENEKVRAMLFSNPTTQPIPTISKDKDLETDTLTLIQQSASLEELKTYKYLASAGDQILYDAYCQRIKELSNV